MVRTLLKLLGEPRQADAADALAIAINTGHVAARNAMQMSESRSIWREAGYDNDAKSG